ncbi:hypothetical protein H7X69_00595 [Candidatus Saccharibacteria bacterium]|nr:hypothetical protein [Candidatus Saccharibacteria bacterium]
MTIEYLEDLSVGELEVMARSPKCQTAIDTIEAGLALSIKGGYAEPKVEGKTLGHWLATDLFRLGLDIDEVRDILDRYAPNYDTVVVSSGRHEYGDIGKARANDY